MKYLIIIVLSALTGVVFAIMEWPIEIMYVVIAVIGIVSMANVFYVNSFTKNMQAIEKYLAKSKKNPIYYYAYILPTATDEELIDSLQQIIKKYPNTKYQSIYSSYLAILQQDIETAKDTVKPIAQTEIGRYIKALIDIHEGDYEAATKHEFKKPWMQHSILAHIAYFQKDATTLNEQATLATDGVGGIQHYVNFHSFAKMKNELQKNQP